MEQQSKQNEVSCLYLGSKLFLIEKRQKLITQAQSLDHHEVHLDHNNCPTIIKQIVHCRFPHLRLLQLSHNRIVSVEALGRLDASQLKNLYLSYNDLVSVKSIRKCSFPLLEKLSVLENKIVDFDFLGQCNFPNLKTLHLETLAQKEKNKFCKVCVLGKMVKHPDMTIKINKNGTYLLALKQLIKNY